MMKKAVAIIPARGGSKRIPKKNIRPFFGKPMIQYSIDAALRSELFERVIVSADTDEIRKIAEQLGAESPFDRPAKLADDFTPLADVVYHSLEWLRDSQHQFYNYACCILATAPFIRAEDLKRGYEVLKNSGVSSVVPVTSFPYPIFRALQVDKNSLAGARVISFQRFTRSFPRCRAILLVRCKSIHDTKASFHA